MSALGAPNFAEDAAASSGDRGIPILGVRKDQSSADQTSADGDYGMLTLNSRGNVMAELQHSPAGVLYMAQSAFFTAASSATDMWEIYGSGSKTVEVLKIWVSYETSTTSSANRFHLLRRTTANSGGTSTTLDAIELETALASATAVLKNYTANPTTGTLFGATPTGRMWAGSITTSTSGGAPHMIFDAHVFGKPIILSGTGEGVVVNNNGVTVPGSSPVIAVGCLWRER